MDPRYPQHSALRRLQPRLFQPHTPAWSARGPTRPLPTLPHGNVKQDNLTVTEAGVKEINRANKSIVKIESLVKDDSVEKEIKEEKIPEEGD